MVVMTRPGDGAGGSLVLWPASRRLPIVASNVVMNVQRAKLYGSGHIRAQMVLPMRYLNRKKIARQIS
jgi:hypothetical protein